MHVGVFFAVLITVTTLVGQLESQSATG